MKIKFKGSLMFSLLTFSIVYGSTASQTQYSPNKKLGSKVGSLVRNFKSAQQEKASLKQQKTATGLAALVNLNSFLHAITEGKDIRGFCQPELSNHSNQSFMKKAGGHLDLILEPCFNRLYNAVLSYYRVKSRLSFAKLPSFCKNTNKLGAIVVDFYQIKNDLADDVDTSTSEGANQQTIAQKNFFKVKDCVQSVRNSLEKRAPSSARSQELKQTFDELGFR